MSTLIEKLTPLGFDKADAMKRFMNNEKLIDKCIKKFPEQVEKVNFKKDVENKDWLAGVEHAHTLKGVTGNLSFKNLFEMYTIIVDRIRANDTEHLEDYCEKALALEQTICDAIKAEEE